MTVRLSVFPTTIRVPVDSPCVVSFLLVGSLRMKGRVLKGLLPFSFLLYLTISNSDKKTLEKYDSI